MTVCETSVHSRAADSDYGFGVLLGALSSLLLALPAAISFWGSSNLSIIDKVSEMPLLREKTLWSPCPCSSLEGCRWAPLLSRLPGNDLPSCLTWGGTKESRPHYSYY